MPDSSTIAKRMRLECLGRAPELISYMAMSIRLSPSLTRAITFAAKNMDDPISSRLKRILWNVYTKKFHSVEESFAATATEWGKWNEDLKRGLFAIKSSSLETTEEGLERSLDKATDIVISGTKKKMEEFASSLSTPTTILFALGILLPMILGAMLPMISLGNLDLSYQASGLGQTEPSGGIQPILIVVMMDVVFPLATLSYAMNILAKRPGIGSSVRIEDESRRRRRALVLSLALGLALATIGILTFDGFGSYVLILSVALPTSFCLISTTHKRRKERQEILRMEREFPDALFQLGTRIAEGSPPERAILETAKSMKDAKIAELFHKVYYRTIVFGLTLENALFGDRGLMRDFPSRTVEATMKSFVEVARKDSISAGQMMIKTSEYLKDLQKLEEDTKRKLRSSVESMKMTSLFFAPIVMGVTFSLYTLLVDTFSRVGSVGDMMSPSVFLIVLGVYLLLMAAIAMYFVSTIEKVTDRVERGYYIGVGIVVAAGIFTISSIVGQMAIA
jgi:Flp pilus assembly protein TadB